MRSEQSIRYRKIDSETVAMTSTGKNIYPDRQLDLSNSKSYWCYAPEERPMNHVQPVLCWETRADGTRRYLYDNEEIEKYFPGSLAQQVKGLRRNPLTGLLMTAYLQPERRGHFPKEMKLPKVLNQAGQEEGPDDHQPMQEGQIPLLAMYFDRVFLRHEMFAKLEALGNAVR